MHITSIRTICFEQPAVPIHAKRFASPQEIVLTVVRSDTGLEGFSMARAHGGQPGAGIAQAIVKSIAPGAGVHADDWGVEIDWDCTESHRTPSRQLAARWDKSVFQGSAADGQAAEIS